MTWSLKRTVKMSKVLGIAESIIKGLEHGEVTVSKPFSVLENICMTVFVLMKLTLI